MEIGKEKIEALAQEYDINIEEVMEYYEELRKIPCVATKDEEYFFECLEMIVQAIRTNLNNKEYRENQGQELYDEDITPTNIIVSEALYRVYEDDAIPYLSDEYKEMKQISNNDGSFSL